MSPFQESSALIKTHFKNVSLLGVLIARFPVRLPRLDQCMTYHERNMTTILNVGTTEKMEEFLSVDRKIINYCHLI